jgi:hypothetical protein
LHYERPRETLGQHFDKGVIMTSRITQHPMFPRVGVAVLAFASGYLFASFDPFQWRFKTPTVIEVANHSEQGVSVIIRDHRLFQVGELAAGEAKSKMLPKAGLYEVLVSDATGKVVATSMVAPSSSDGTRVQFKDGDISELARPSDV